MIKRDDKVLECIRAVSIITKQNLQFLYRSHGQQHNLQNVKALNLNSIELHY